MLPPQAPSSFPVTKVTDSNNDIFEAPSIWGFFFLAFPTEIQIRIWLKHLSSLKFYR